MQTVDPKVSVIIPCYNGEHFIGDAIKSVLSQTYKELEIIIVDDGSTDKSKDVLGQYESDARVVCLAHEQNRGIPAARNTGIRHSRGEYIAFLDQDDIWRQKKLAKQIQRLKEDTAGEIGLVFSNVETIQDIDGRKKRWITRAPQGIGEKSRKEVVRSLFLDNFIPIVSATVRRECFDKLGLLDETILSGADDYEFCFRVAMKYRLAHIEEPLVAHRNHGKNFSDVQKFYPDNLKILGKVVEAMPELADLKGRRLSHLNLERGNSFLNDGEMEEAKKAYKASWHYDRSNAKAFIGMLASYTGPLGKALAKRWFTIKMT
jgi:glycosyltransferase involved in cell wall biosynthesis